VCFVCFVNLEGCRGVLFILSRGRSKVVHVMFYVISLDKVRGFSVRGGYGINLGRLQGRFPWPDTTRKLQERTLH